MLNGFRKRITSIIMGKRESGAPIILTEWGAVDEGARLQAAMNIKADPEIRARVEGMLIEKFGKVRGMEEMRRRYPEAF